MLIEKGCLSLEQYSALRRLDGLVPAHSHRHRKLIPQRLSCRLNPQRRGSTDGRPPIDYAIDSGDAQARLLSDLPHRDPAFDQVGGISGKSIKHRVLDKSSDLPSIGDRIQVAHT